MAPARNQPQLPIIRVAPLGELNAYTIYEHELETLAEGSPGGLFLNFALTLLPTAIGIIVTLRSSTMTDLNFMLFTSASIIFVIAGLICLVLWWRTHNSVTTLVEEIKKRMPLQPGIQTTPAASPAINPPAAAP
jgi:high-affinity Fe2+/Pb2+ permease